MSDYQRQYPLFSACGLNCGLCPRYHTDGTSRCPGCCGEGFFTKHPACGVVSCIQRHDGIEYCFQCDEYPCQKYEKSSHFDSFITHQHMFTDFEKAKHMGLMAYQAELNQKVEILQQLLDDYNDGRRKNFFCIAVNLLELQDVNDVMAELTTETNSDQTVKEKSAAAVARFQAMADRRNIVLKLNQKKSDSDKKAPQSV